jgi:hypothetical protein
MIDLDSLGASGRQSLAFSTAIGLSRYTEVTRPEGPVHTTGPTPSGPSAGPLPRADVLGVTWAVHEVLALSRQLTGSSRCQSRQSTGRS